MKRKIILFISLLFIPFNIKAYSDKIIPGGNTIGIEVSSDGVMVVGFYKVDGKCNKTNPEIKIGDYIIKINNENVETVDDLINLVEKYENDKKVNITFRRGKKEYNTFLELIEIDNSYKTGLYVKDKITGIGTLSYIDPETNLYGALGHEIIESSSKNMIDIDDGSIFKNVVTSIDRSVNGSPGSKNAKFYSSNIYGNILKNTKYGIYGNLNKDISSGDAIEIKKLSDINLGKAYIRTVVNGEEIKEYEIEITDINKNSKLKSITFKITDEELLKQTGGIVQGMSGSPIIQDGYLIGAVTHVIVDDVTKGYGVSIITMLDEGDKLLNKN
ncbi:MAG: SpoIVB peptidase [Bacilli bacterium]|nr:SpoIVB peptidase [Bacilli bacterium]